MSHVYDLNLYRAARQVRKPSHLTGQEPDAPDYPHGDLDDLYRLSGETADKLAEVTDYLASYSEELGTPSEFTLQHQYELLLEYQKRVIFLRKRILDLRSILRVHLRR